MEQGTLRIGIVGAGAVGSVLARAATSVGFAVVAIADRSEDRARTLASEVSGRYATTESQAVVDSSDLVFLTVPDDLIETVCSSVTWTPDKAAVHCSGALSLDVLSHASDAGARVGSCHPMQTFAGDEHASHLHGCMFGIESAEPLRSRLDDLVRRVGGWSVFLTSEDKSRYHLAGVLASNYLVTLIGEAAGIFEDIGLTEHDAIRGLMPLVQGTVRNLDAGGVAHALTGPISRGDTGTVQRHLETLATQNPALRPLYVALGNQTVQIALDSGRIEQDAAASLREMLNTADSSGIASAGNGVI